MQSYIYYINRCNITRYTAAQRSLVPVPAAVHDPYTSHTPRNMHSARPLVATVDFYTAASTSAGLSEHEKGTSCEKSRRETRHGRYSLQHLAYIHRP